MISDTIYEHLKDLSNTSVKSMIESTTVIDPSSTIGSVLANLSKKDSYDAFYFDGKTVHCTNIRALLVGKDISDMKIGPFLSPIRHLKPTSNIQKAS